MSISNRVKRLLWSRSGGYCQNPACRRELFFFFENGEINSIEELAHIIGRSRQGPRGDEDLDATQRDEYKNIILLCPNCHTLVDKNPHQFPTEMLRHWKTEHDRKVRLAFVAPVMKTRGELGTKVHGLLRRNRQIFLTYGPHSKSSGEPLSDAASMWQHYIQTEIIPNNRRLAELLVANEHLLTKNELDVLERFLVHRDAFEYNHLSGDKFVSAPPFPTEMNSMLQD